jgi:uncharacterized protein (TIGR00251 family)
VIKERKLEGSNMTGKNKSQQLQITVLAKPSSKQTAIEFLDEEIVVRLKSAAQKGKANKELINLIAEYFGLKDSQITIARGATSTTKTVEISKLTKQKQEDLLFRYPQFRKTR